MQNTAVREKFVNQHGTRFTHEQLPCLPFPISPYSAGSQKYGGAARRALFFNAQPPEQTYLSLATHLLIDEKHSAPSAPSTILHVSGHTRPKWTPRQPTRSASRRIAQETKTPTDRHGRRRSKPNSDDERVPASVFTSWLGEDEEMGDAERSSSGSGSTNSQCAEDEAINGGLSSPTKAAVARKTRTKVVDDDDHPPRRLAPAPA